ncbi:MAG: restriction endonuclease [Magnetococcales bacterium]|nr:restriction endonuclease [Magnetococcales bacterium]
MAITPHGRMIVVKDAVGPRSRFRRDSFRTESESTFEHHLGETTVSHKIIDNSKNGSLFVGNLPWNMTDTALLKIFSRVGDVLKVSCVLDRISGRSHGFAYVWMCDERVNHEVINKLDGVEITDSGDIVSDFASDNVNNIHKSASTMVSIVENASKEFVRMICDDPRKLNELEWRDLERVLAVVFDGIGYTTKLTRSSKDGGKDIVIEFIAHNDKKSYFVEVKHWVSGKVGEKYVSRFISILIEDKPTGGIILSTSGFSKFSIAAITEIKQQKLRFGDGGTIVSLCRTYLNVMGGLFKPVDHAGIISSLTWAL